MTRTEDKIIELVDRCRRIETKLSRYIAGQNDRGVTTIDYYLDRQSDSWYVLHLHTGNVTLVQLSELLNRENVPQGAHVEVLDDGRILLHVVMR